MNRLYVKPGKVRSSSPTSGKEISLPPDTLLSVGDEIDQYYGRIVLVVPKGSIVDQHMIMSAIKFPQTA